jgi:predicted ATP-grasp superfamily ATP-dependent carboligase
VRDRFPGVVIPFVTAEQFARISDKQAVLEAAQRVGVAIPEQTVVDDATMASALDLDTLRYPIVVKPARSVAGESSARAKFSVVHAASPGELRSTLEGMDARAFPLLLQQRIVGPGVGIFLLLWQGDCLAQFSHRRLREKPPSGGISVYRESIALDPSLAARSRALLNTFGWEGVAMIEYKVDAASGTPYLMEINGRFWGSLQLAIDAGVDFPRLLVDAVTGGSPTPVTEYRAGVRSRWFWGDLDHLIARVRFDDVRLALPPGAPTRLQAMRAFMRRSPGDVEEILRLDDPKPFLRETVQWFRSLGSA